MLSIKINSETIRNNGSQITSNDNEFIINDIRSFVVKVGDICFTIDEDLFNNGLKISPGSRCNICNEDGTPGGARNGLILITNDMKYSISITQHKSETSGQCLKYYGRSETHIQEEMRKKEGNMMVIVPSLRRKTKEEKEFDGDTYKEKETTALQVKEPA